MMADLRNILDDESGNSLIEMAFAAPLLAGLLIGMVDISRAVSAKVQLEQAAQRTIEKAQARTYKTSDNSTLQSDAQSAAGSGSTATIDSWLECNHDGVHLNFDSDSCAAGATYARYVKVTVEKPYTPFFDTRYFPGANSNGTVTVRGKATLRVQ